jgi:hypothetical protein
MERRAVVLVEGTSDQHAVETLARRRGRDLVAEGVEVVPMGGFGNLPRAIEQHRGVPLVGLYDPARSGTSCGRSAARIAKHSSAPASLRVPATSKTN